MSKVKILLDKSPNFIEECPFMISDTYGCRIDGCECHCVWYFHDSQNFDFSQCPYCKTFIKQDYE